MHVGDKHPVRFARARACAALASLALACSGGSGRDAGAAGAAAAMSAEQDGGTAGRGGSAGSSTSTAGAGGGAGEGSAGRGGSGGSSGAAAPRSERSACLAYTGAVCKRLFECGANDVDCSAEYEDLCPDWVFAEGSTRTIDDVFACAEAWRSEPCAEVRLGSGPACGTPGTFAAGEPCFSPAQCESQVCGGRVMSLGSECLTCARLAAPGEACDQAGVACPRPPSMGLTDPAPLSMGAECDYPAACAAGLQCRDDEARVRRCLPPRALGEPCMFPLHCQLDLGHECYADAQGDMRCTLPPVAGEPCAQVSPDSAPIACARGFRCNASGRCEALPPAGEPCAQLEDGTPLHRCALDASCVFDGAMDPGVCVPAAALGEPCRCRVVQLPEPPNEQCPDQATSQPVPDCGAGLLCHCENCEDASCVERKREGQACDDGLSVCEDGTECSGGVCTALESLGVFERVCG